MHLRAASTVLLLSLLPLPAYGAGSPSLQNVLPRGGQRGQEVLVEFTGARLDRAVDVVFYQPGIQLARLEQVDAGRVKCTLKIDPAARPGLLPLRLRTGHGLSNVKLFSIGTSPELRETEPNNEPAKAHNVALPAVLNGMITQEDVDVFAFDARKGQVFAFEIEGLRLGDTLFDPHLAVMDATGRELAVADDTPLVRQDGVLLVTFPADGRYLVAVRETAYGGNDACHYRLHAGPMPRPLAAMPAGGQAGAEVEITWIGDPAAPKQKVKLPDAPAEEFGLFAENGSALSPSAVPFRLCDKPSIIEAEPNNDDEHATTMPAPGGASGAAAGERDVDCFVFEGKKGQAFEASVHARRLRSPLDPVLNIRRHKGAGVAGGDDGAGPDSVVRFTCPDDGKYVLEVRDLLFKSGPEHTYFLELSPIVPKLALTMQPEQATLAIPPGNRAAILLTASRGDFGGPLVVSANGLPAGVQMHVDTMSDAVNQIPVVFEAAADAKPAGALVDLVARHADANVKIEGRLRQSIDLIRFQNTSFYTVTVDRLATAVTETVPFKISIVEPKVPIVRRGMMELPIQVERSGDFKGEIEVRMLWTPPGVGAGTLKIAGDKSAGTIHLDANDGARVGKWKIAAVAVTDLGGGPFEVSSQLATLEVAEPFLDFTVEKARTELGKPVEMVVKVAHKTPFEGQASAELIGLPPKVATTQAAVTAATPEVKYRLEVPTSAPAGRHGGVFVRAVVTREGQPVVHQSPAGELTLDAPLPPKDPQEEARRAEAKRKAEEEQARKKAERLAAAEKRREEARRRQEAGK